MSRGLYPALETNRTGFLDTGDGHHVYWEESGNPNGKPVLFVHGGPGGGTDPKHRRFFDPARYRIVLFDQRGCGKSTPFASVSNNTTQLLIGDMEALRDQLGIERMQIFGGSWGSTLGLAYAQAHPERVSELVLRGIFLLRRWEIEWFYQSGASRLFPQAWEHFLAPIPSAEHGDLLAAYHQRLMGPDQQLAAACARAWSIWEGSTSCLLEDPGVVARMGDPSFALAFARIECHYFKHAGFFEADGQLLRDAPRIAHLPAVIVQGRYDVVCPAQSAFELSQALPKSRLIMVGDAGHSAMEAGTLHELVSATDRFAEQA